MLPPEIRQQANSYATDHAENAFMRTIILEAFIAGAQVAIEYKEDVTGTYDPPEPDYNCTISFAEKYSFEDFWREYDYKKAKPQALKMWKKLSKVQKEGVMQALPAYIASTPDKQFRMHPATFLNPSSERWKDEITIKAPKANAQQRRLNTYSEAISSIGKDR